MRTRCRGLTLVELMVSSTLLLLVVGAMMTILHSSKALTQRSSHESDLFRAVTAAAASLRREMAAARVVSPLPGERLNELDYRLPGVDTLTGGFLFDADGAIVYNVSATVEVVDGQLVLDGPAGRRVLGELGTAGEVTFERKDERFLVVVVEAVDTSVDPPTRYKVPTTYYLANQP